MTSPVVLPSLSAAMDGGFTAIHDVSEAMSTAGAADEDRLIGGVAVMLHVQRLELDLPLRATGDADFGVPPHVPAAPTSWMRSRLAATARCSATGGSDNSTIGGSPRSTC